MTRPVKNTTLGFTLIELLVVIAIIGLLSSIVLGSLTLSRERAKTSGAQSQLKEIEKALAFLVHDTGVYPADGSNKPTSPCSTGDEVYIDEPEAGIVATDGNFPNWNGPYLSMAIKDPWGTYYRFDDDYRCGATTVGCKKIADSGNDSSVILSFGPDKSQSYGNGDDIVLILCKR